MIIPAIARTRNGGAILTVHSLGPLHSFRSFGAPMARVDRRPPLSVLGTTGVTLSIL
jgi:hypothetical protein